MAENGIRLPPRLPPASPTTATTTTCMIMMTFIHPQLVVPLTGVASDRDCQANTVAIVSFVWRQTSSAGRRFRLQTTIVAGASFRPLVLAPLVFLDLACSYRNFLAVGAVRCLIQPNQVASSSSCSSSSLATSCNFEAAEPIQVSLDLSSSDANDDDDDNLHNNMDNISGPALHATRSI